VTSASEIPRSGSSFSLDPEHRERLGVEVDESVRVLQRGPRTLLLERCREGHGMALPWDRDLVFAADVRSFPLADLLETLHDAGKSGFLFFAHADQEKAIYLHRGEVVFGTSNQVVDRLGESLLRAGALSAGQLSEACGAVRPQDRLGKVLVERALLTPQELWNGVKTQVEEIVRSLFAYTSGTVLFWEGDVQPDNVVRLALPTQRLVKEGLAKRDELLRFLAQLQDPRARLVRTADPVHRDLTPNEHALIEGLELETHFPALCQRAGLDPLSGARTVQMLCLLGLMQLSREGAGAPAPTSRGDESAVRDCVRDHLQLVSELSMPLVSVDGPGDVAHRVQNVVSEAAARHPELLAGLCVAAGGLLDPEEVTRRAVRLPRDRVGAVRRALGELISYLEFELMNHPRIEDPDVFLDAVESLRAKIES